MFYDIIYYYTVRTNTGCCLLFLTFSALVANPKKTTFHGGQSRSWSAEQGKKKKKSLAAPPPPPRARGARSEKKKKKKRSRDASTFIYRRYASRRYAGGLGPSRIRTRIPTTRQLGQWVSLRKTLRFRVRLQLSQSRCLSLLLLAMSGRVFLFLPPRYIIYLYFEHVHFIPIVGVGKDRLTLIGRHGKLPRQHPLLWNYLEDY